GQPSIVHRRAASETCQIDHQRHDPENHQNKDQREAQPEKDEVAGLAVTEIARAILSALHAQGAGQDTLQHLAKRQLVLVVAVHAYLEKLGSLSLATARISAPG